MGLGRAAVLSGSLADARGCCRAFPAQLGRWEPGRQPTQEGNPASQIGSGPSAFIAIEGSQALALFG